MAPTVVVLGGAYGGLHVAHYLLKNTDVKVILVSKSSQFFWNMASVRAIVPGTFDDSKLYFDLADALGRYNDRAELIVGSADAVDTTAKTVTVGVKGAEKRSISYDHLVLATGARCTLPEKKTDADAIPLAPWKADGTIEEYKALLADTQAKVVAAKHIVVAGAGSTGIEAAAELGAAYGKGADAKTIVLLSGSDEILRGESSVGGSAMNELKKLNVDVRTRSRVTGARTLEDGRVELTVAGSDAPIVTDLYLASIGLTANTEYLDAKHLNEHKYVNVDEFYRVSGVADNSVWAVGDVVSKPRAGFMITQKQAAGVAKNIQLVVGGKAPAPVKLLPVDILAVATGPSRGVGRISWFPMFSFMVWAAKGRTLGTERLSTYLTGSVA